MRYATAHRKTQAGSAMIVGLVLLVVVTVLGVSTSSSRIIDTRMSYNFNSHVKSHQIAQAGIDATARAISLQIDNVNQQLAAASESEWNKIGVNFSNTGNGGQLNPVLQIQPTVPDVTDQGLTVTIEKTDSTRAPQSCFGTSIMNGFKADVQCDYYRITSSYHSDLEPASATIVAGLAVESMRLEREQNITNNANEVKQQKTDDCAKSARRISNALKQLGFASSYTNSYSQCLNQKAIIENSIPRAKLMTGDDIERLHRQFEQYFPSGAQSIIDGIVRVNKDYNKNGICMICVSVRDGEASYSQGGYWSASSAAGYTERNGARNGGQASCTLSPCGLEGGNNGNAVALSALQISSRKTYWFEQI
jgi:Tfp pilus assembly protein PilX